MPTQRQARSTLSPSTCLRAMTCPKAFLPAPRTRHADVENRFEQRGFLSFFLELTLQLLDVLLSRQWLGRLACHHRAPLASAPWMRPILQAVFATPYQNCRPTLYSVAHLRLPVRHLAFFHLLDNAQFKSQTVIALAAPKPLFHLTLLLCIEKVSTYSRMGQAQKKSRISDLT